MLELYNQRGKHPPCAARYTLWLKGGIEIQLTHFTVAAGTHCGFPAESMQIRQVI